MKKYKLSVVGNNLQNFVNALINRKIQIYNAQIVDNVLYFEVQSSNVNKILTLFQKSNYEITILKSPLYKTKKEFFIKNLGIILSICLFFISCYTYTQHIWQYRIYGTENIDSNSIIQVLNDNGIKIGLNKRSIDTNNIERILQKNINNIALVSVNIAGSTLVISLSEKIDNTDLLDNTKPIISQYDCVITDIKTISGTPLVKKGDKVTAGQTLIGNYVVDSNGGYTQAKAIGEIYADVFFTYQKTYFKNEEILVRSNNKYVYNDINLFGIDLINKKSSKYKNYELESKVLTINNIFKITITQNTVYELIYTKIENDLNDIDKLTSDTIRLVKQKYSLDKYDDLITDVSKNEDYVTISTSFVVHKKIV